MRKVFSIALLALTLSACHHDDPQAATTDAASSAQAPLMPGDILLPTNPTPKVAPSPAVDPNDPGDGTPREIDFICHAESVGLGTMTISMLNFNIDEHGQMVGDYAMTSSTNSKEDDGTVNDDGAGYTFLTGQLGEISARLIQIDDTSHYLNMRSANVKCDLKHS